MRRAGQAPEPLVERQRRIDHVVQPLQARHVLCVAALVRVQARDPTAVGTAEVLGPARGVDAEFAVQRSEVVVVAHRGPGGGKGANGTAPAARMQAIRAGASRASCLRRD